MQNYVQNASVNIFNRCYWNFRWWQTYLDVLVNLYFEIYFVKNLICLIFLVSSFYFSWYFQCESPLFAIDVISNFNFFSEYVASMRITTCTERELSFRIISISSRCVMRKMWIRVLWIIHFIVYFSLEEVLQGLSRNNPTKKLIDAEIQVTLKNAPTQKRTDEKMFYRLLQQIIKPNCKLILIASENVFSINFCCFDYFNYCYCNRKILVTKPNYKLTLIASECVIHKFCCLGYLLLLL